MTGFYWTANTPYLQDLEIEVSRYPKVDTGKRSIYFCLDYSGSMAGTKITALKAAMATVFATIREAIGNGQTFDVGACLFGDSPSFPSQTSEYLDATQANIDSLAAFIDGQAIIGGTDFNDAITPAVTFFTNSLADTDIVSRVLFFVTDGEPVPTSTATTAAATAADLIDQSTGDFNTTDGTSVRIFGINIELADTQYTELLDNTPADGVPVVTGADPSGILDALNSVLFPGAIGDDANPAYIILETLINRQWGAGMSDASIDRASFDDAATALYNEGLGLSFSWTQETSVETMIREVLDHIDAVIYANPRTGRLTLKLIRNDYDVNTLRTLDETNAILKRFERRAVGETINEIQVTWTDPETEEDAATPAIQDLGNIAMQGAVVSDSRNFYGVRNRDLALTLGYRELMAASAPLATAEVEVNREFWDVTPGEVVKLVWPERSISQLLMRVIGVDYGRPKKSEIRLTLIEDVFGLDDAVFEAAPETLHDDGTQTPTAIAFSKVLTLPYYVQQNKIPADIRADVAYPEVFAGVLGSQTGTDTQTFDLYAEKTDSLGNVYFGSVGVKSVVAYGLLPEELPEEATTTIDPLGATTFGLPATVGDFLLIGNLGEADDELAVITAIESAGAGITIARGVLDTTPKTWAAGTPFRIITQSSVWTDSTVRAALTDVDYKILPITSSGVLAEGDAGTITYSLTERPYLPTRPADVKVNTVGFGTVDSIGNPVEVTWVNRNRVTEDSTILLWTDAGVTAEAGQTTTVTVLTLGDDVLATHDNVSSPYTVPSGDYSTEPVIKVRVTSKRDGYESLQGHEIIVLVSSNAFVFQDDSLIQLQDDNPLELN